MDYGYLADFHTHTGASDGLGSAWFLYRIAKERGYAAVAVTDHDTLDEARWCYGFSHHQKAVGETGPTMVPGVELSSLITAGDTPDPVHVLGLGIDPYADELTALCYELKVRRSIELERKLSHARSCGLELKPEAEGRVRAHAFWGKHEIARELVLAEEFETVDAAYHALWDNYRLVVDDGLYVEAERAIGAIHYAGGLAVLAHPLRDEAHAGRVALGHARRRIDALQSLGLDGVECYYRACSLEACEALDAYTRSRGLLISCGSDHHDFGRRLRFGVTCADGVNYAYRTNVAEALGIA